MDTEPKVVLDPIEDMIKRLHVGAAFGEPIHEGDSTLIPVASVTYGFGYGSGYGQGPTGVPGQSTEGTGPGEVSEGGGGGGGAGGRVKPQGYIHISGGEVHYEPLVNPTVMSLAGIAMMAWSVFWIAKALRAFAGKRCCG